MTPIQPNLNEIEYLTNFPFNPEEVYASKPLNSFAEHSISFLNQLGNVIVHDPRSKEFPDLLTFAFWCSSSNLAKQREICASYGPQVGRGVIFHITPSNVPINFAYSLACGVITGNVNIVRVPTKLFPQIDIVIDSLNFLIQQETFAWISKRVFLLRYSQDKAVTDFFSSNCDVRIIWGGDQAIMDIRQSPIPPKSFDLVFADRYSLCVIESSAYLKAPNHERIARDFFNDTYLFDQNACTSPHLICWVGSANESNEARRLFWSHLETVVLEKYKILPIQSINKICAAFYSAAIHPGSVICSSIDNLITRILLTEPPKSLVDEKSNSGYFIEFISSSLSAIETIENRSFQTLTIFGFDNSKIENFVNESQLFGIDRIVPIGKAHDFSLLWDGFNIAGMLTRQIDIR